MMVDTSRGRVPTVATHARTAMQAALTGYSHLLLYMEDTYEVRVQSSKYYVCVSKYYVIDLYHQHSFIVCRYDHTRCLRSLLASHHLFTSHLRQPRCSAGAED
jgi:hypothetical protein